MDTPDPAPKLSPKDRAFAKMDAVSVALEPLDKDDAPTAYALFVFAYENLRRVGFGPSRVIEMQLAMEKDRGGRKGGN